MHTHGRSWPSNIGSQPAGARQFLRACARFLHRPLLIHPQSLADVHRGTRRQLAVKQALAARSQSPVSSPLPLQRVQLYRETACSQLSVSSPLPLQRVQLYRETACSQLSVSSPLPLQRVQLYREIRVHSKLQHQNIVQFYAAFLVSRAAMDTQSSAAVWLRAVCFSGRHSGWASWVGAAWHDRSVQCRFCAVLQPCAASLMGQAEAAPLSPGLAARGHLAV